MGASTVAAGWILFDGFGVLYGQLFSRAFHASRGVAAVPRAVAESLARVTLAGAGFFKRFATDTLR